MNDEEAIEILKKGELSGLDVLVVKYQEKAHRTAYLITRDNDLARDAVQESFLRVYQNIRRIDQSRPFEPYLFRSVVNTALNMTEKLRRETDLDDDLPPIHLEDLLGRASSTEDLVEYAQLKEQIVVCLDRLPARERAVLIERYYLGMNEKEMADHHDVAPGTVKWLLNTARKRMRAFIGTEDE